MTVQPKMKTTAKALFAGAILVAAAPGAAFSANAAEWPTENVRLILPFSAGGSIDRFARGLTQHWEEFHDYAMIVDNRGGASGLLGSRTFLGSPSNGHYLFAGIQPTLSMNIVAQGADFDLDDFTFINIEQRDYTSIVVRADSPYETIEELVESIRENPGSVTMSMATGSGTHLFGLAFLDTLELNPNIVTFDGGGEQRTDLLGGHSDAAFSSAYGDMTLGDQVRVLAVSSHETFPGWPDAPPVNEAFPEADLPAIGDNRFLAVHTSFAEENPEAFEAIVASYQEVFNSDAYQAHIENLGSDLISGYYGPEESKEIIYEIHEVVERYGDMLSGN
ncbi:tripartite tricarboxylate transporter substrate binding protein [Halomonas sp. MCCC 1A11062]|uniref:tripartite tricarboxylate transporter substrate binding protein n=1 Tax=Halomonas sp. MCCC 1A11062 TaxID=2733485 RepID=UPI001F308312|nr:tripartite tricarboxylate transporter substrate binding protein [Halomonas sp. MCCC 1A11062]MCE8038952.1 tripartite tricarboxylate transporter substrate binding protein [Halomonas sp. MCCC 1A11062]